MTILLKRTNIPQDEEKEKRFVKHVKRKSINRWVSEHREAWNKKQREQAQRIRSEVLTFLGNKCVRCGETDIRCLQVDHVNGGGVQELRRIRGATYFRKVFQELKRGSKAYQCLCANCNWRKRYEREEISEKESNERNM